uniref:PID domain-containing protein n=1 Tax=Macrostomum lignano TaxID=282301 RepID=A0A1I8I6D5_9PLAT
TDSLKGICRQLLIRSRTEQLMLADIRTMTPEGASVPWRQDPAASATAVAYEAAAGGLSDGAGQHQLVPHHPY